MFQHARIVARAMRTLMVDEMEARNALQVAIVTQHERHAPRILRRYHILSESRVQCAIPLRHVRHALVTDRARIISGGIILQAFHMHTMAASQEHHLVRAGCQIVRAYRAVRIQATFTARMCILRVQRHAIPTRITVMIVNPQPFADAADATPVAMIRSMPRTVIEELTHAAEIAREAHAARSTPLTHGLVRITAIYACYQFCSVTVDLMRLPFIMAPPASVIALAARSLDPATPIVMLTPS